MSEAEQGSDIERVVVGESSVDAPSGSAGDEAHLPDCEGEDTMDGTEVAPSREAAGESMRSEDEASDTDQTEESQYGGGDAEVVGSKDGKKGEDNDGINVTDERFELKEDEAGSAEVVEMATKSEVLGSSVDADPGDVSVNESRQGAAKTKPKASASAKTIEDNDEEVDVGDLSQLTEDSRNILFGRGLVYERAGKKNCALKCYLACLSHLSPQSNFVLLPQCLRNIADLYYRKEQYEKAILFIQAEKLFYENALIDTSEVQQKIEALREGLENSDTTRSSEDVKIAADSLRADEYEHLAKLCVDKKQPQLALEYAGKATKLRQKIYGSDNPITKESLDFFATLYAEVGKQQYSDSMSHLSDPVEDDGESVSPPVTPSMERSPSSILRQRKTGDSESDKKKQVRFQEPEGAGTSPNTESTRENEEFISHSLLWILFFICSVLLGVLGVWLFCSLTESLMCKWISGELQYLYMRMKYYYYQYASTKKVKYT